MAARPKRPYLIRALNDWIVDSDMTPYLMVDASDTRAQLPVDFVKDGKIVLNISPSAVRDLVLGDDAISFSARFNGNPFSVYVPMQQVLAIYARETSEGMMFDAATDASALPSERGDDDEPPPDSGPRPSGGHLKLVD